MTEGTIDGAGEVLAGFAIFSAAARTQAAHRLREAKRGGL
jgi:hypothetical protein